MCRWKKIYDVIKAWTAQVYKDLELGAPPWMHEGNDWRKMGSLLVWKKDWVYHLNKIHLRNSDHTLRTMLLRTPSFWFGAGFGDAPINFAQGHRYIVMCYIFTLTVTRLDCNIME